MSDAEAGGEGLVEEAAGFDAVEGDGFVQKKMAAGTAGELSEAGGETVAQRLVEVALAVVDDARDLDQGEGQELRMRSRSRRARRRSTQAATCSAGTTQFKGP